MVRKRWTTNFERSEVAYRTFLMKFIENPNFDSESIGTALEYAYDISLKNNKPLQVRTKGALVKTILTNKRKILEDLNTLKAFPESVFEPLAPDISLQRYKKMTNQAMLTASNKRHNDDDLSNIICKKLKLTTPENKNIKCTINRWKEKYLQQRKNYRKRMLINNKSLRKILNIEKKKNIPYLEETRIPIVLLENSETLQEMVKNFNSQKENEEQKNKDIEKENNASEYRDEDRQKSERENETEIQNNSSLQSIQNYTNENEIPNETLNLSYAKNSIYIKQEIDLVENPCQTDTSKSPLNSTELCYEYEEDRNETGHALESEGNSQLSQHILNSSTPTTFRDDVEIMPSLKIPYNNNISFELPFNNACLLNNTPMTLNSNYATCLITPISQFDPNITLMNSNGFNGFYGICNQLGHNLSHQNTSIPVSNFGMTSAQSLVNQTFNPVQEIAKLQTAIFNLNAQVSSLGNLVIRSHSSYLNLNL